jgi:hypothetical protein
MQSKYARGHRRHRPTPGTASSRDLSAVAGAIERLAIGGIPFDIMTLQTSRGQAVFYAQTATSARLNDIIIDAKVKPIAGTILIIFLVATIIFGLTLLSLCVSGTQAAQVGVEGRCAHHAAQSDNAPFVRGHSE